MRQYERSFYWILFSENPLDDGPARVLDFISRIRVEYALSQNSTHSMEKWFFFCIFEVKIQLLERRDDKRFHIWYVTWTYFDRKYNSAKFTHLWLDFWVDFFVFHVYALKNIKIYPFLCIKIKNQNSCGIVSMQKLIIATVVISRLNMFQKCPILESLGLFSFHGGSQKISKIDSKIFKNALKTFYT